VNETKAMDVMHHIWNGNWPDNRTPVFKSITLNNKTTRKEIKLNAGKTYSATVDDKDYESESLTYFWEIKLKMVY
jgi:hypothetical protein